MAQEEKLMVHPGHLSLITREILARRNEGPKRSSLYRQGDIISPMMRELEFPLEKFRSVYSQDHVRLEAAMPLDLLFLHQVAVKNSYDYLVISPFAPEDERLPWYGDSNTLTDVGFLLEREDPKRAARKPRQIEGAPQIEAIAPRQIRLGQLDLTLPDFFETEPDIENSGPDF